LVVEQLEDRLALATVTDGTPILTIDLAANDAVTIVANATSYSLALTSGTWNGIDDANVTGNGAANLSVGAAAFNKLNIADSGEGAMVTFNVRVNSGPANSLASAFDSGKKAGLCRSLTS
jgi:hypothetical protein